ncbi:HEL128Wp [Eremothecium sinecaudum]|uniref:HEL128Wp n=1 Tax=Eremothecium sinecaudum TaxID=45286 RepID=A0A109UXC8_9SACH|nr:HEL128Wp [Eremothecium sinecaudum]AMD21152.1 HEL128Wp [Eremothecium sinecaudum]
MPVSKSLTKIQQNMKGKKHTVHPKGRKFQQLNKATLRDDKIQAKKRAHNEKKSNELSRIKFIQDVINTGELKERTVFTYIDTATIISQFIARDDEELEMLKSKRRPNRPPTNRQQLLEEKKKTELREFTTGFLCPDLTKEDNVFFLRHWNGSFGALSTLLLIRVNDKGEKVIG